MASGLFDFGGRGTGFPGVGSWVGGFAGCFRMGNNASHSSMDMVSPGTATGVLPFGRVGIPSADGVGGRDPGAISISISDMAFFLVKCPWVFVFDAWVVRSCCPESELSG